MCLSGGTRDENKVHTHLIETAFVLLPLVLVLRGQGGVLLLRKTTQARSLSMQQGLSVTFDTTEQQQRRQSRRAAAKRRLASQRSYVNVEPGWPIKNLQRTAERKVKGMEVMMLNFGAAASHLEFGPNKNISSTCQAVRRRPIDLWEFPICQR